jgi:hypothetical protein
MWRRWNFRYAADSVPSRAQFLEFDGPGSTAVVIVNETAARLLWSGEEALHKRLILLGNKTPFEVIGVVADSVVNNIGEDPQPVLYYAMPALLAGGELSGSNDRKSGGRSGAVRAAIQPLDPNLPLTNFQTFRKHSIKRCGRRDGRHAVGVFGIYFALVLATIGIYGVMAHSVTQRTAEIGIRMRWGRAHRKC